MNRKLPQPKHCLSISAFINVRYFTRVLLVDADLFISMFVVLYCKVFMNSKEDAYDIYVHNTSLNTEN